mmetsp:Transcript_21041/g.42341  ORF Transcript_21041/g.42341 Transcript_21041/m.42341 type:complete len:140 (+) Transcript_21041:114-533(+)
MGACSSTNDVNRNLVRVGYRSTMSKESRLNDIDEIIARAEKNNRKLKIGGALWYDPETNKVHQILEGEQRLVQALLDVILADKRHHAIVVEDMEQVAERRFQEWGGMKLSESPLLKDCNHNKRTMGTGQGEEQKESAGV